MFACLHAPGNSPLLVECAEYFSPWIEETSADTVVFDIRGLQRICGGPDEIAREIHKRVGIEANLALAGNPDAAVHAARGIRGLTILAAGDEAAGLASLPLYLVGGSSEFACTLDLWGIRTFGEFAALPAAGVAARLGEEGSHRHRLACGQGNRQLRLREEPLRFRQEFELEEAVELLEPLLFLLSQMLGDLCGKLRFHARSTNEIRVVLRLERAGNHEMTLRLPVPLMDQRVFLKLLQLELNERPPRAPVEKVQIEMMPVDPQTVQHGLFLLAAPEPAKLEVTLARIRGLAGAGNVGAPELLNTHRPDAFRMSALKSGTAKTFTVHMKLALHRFRPPYSAQVWCTGYGKPARMFSPIAGGTIVACAGPWQTSGDFWSNDAWDHREWDIEVQNLGLFRIFQEAPEGKWFVTGNYD